MKFNKAVIVAAAATLCASMVLTTVNATNTPPPPNCQSLHRSAVNGNPATCGACLDDHCGADNGVEPCVPYDKTTQKCKDHQISCLDTHTKLKDNLCKLTSDIEAEKSKCTEETEKKAGKVYNDGTGKCACPDDAELKDGACPCPEGQKRNEAGECKSDDSKKDKKVETDFKNKSKEEQNAILKELEPKCEAMHKQTDKTNGKCSDNCLDGYAKRNLDKPDNICYKKFTDSEKCDHKDRELITSDSNKFCVCKGTKKPKTEGEDSANTECSGAAQLIMSSVVVLGSLATSLVFLL